MRMHQRSRFLWTLGACWLLSAPVFAADRVIQNGIDTWVTPADGSTFYSFANNPIPADFFCSGSAPFNGRVVFRGEPLVTGVSGALNKADTIVQRLDDAAFDRQGRAVTRVQLRALSLAGVAPITTRCGKFTVAASLDGPQPITKMLIVRDRDGGGRFVSALRLRAKLTFTPLGSRSGSVLELPLVVQFSPTPNQPWSIRDQQQPAVPGFVLVDTDGDRLADTYLPGTSNFAAGVRSDLTFAADKIREEYICHWITDPGDEKQHCVLVNPNQPPVGEM